MCTEKYEYYYVVNCPFSWQWRYRSQAVYLGNRKPTFMQLCKEITHVLYIINGILLVRHTNVRAALLSKNES